MSLVYSDEAGGDDDCSDVTLVYSDEAVALMTIDVTLVYSDEGL